MCLSRNVTVELERKAGVSQLRSLVESRSEEGKPEEEVSVEVV